MASKKLFKSITMAAVLSLIAGVGTFMSANTTTANADETVNTSSWINNYETTSRSGQTYTGSAIAIQKDGVTQWNTIDTGYSFNEFPFAFSVNDLAGGLMFQIDNSTSNKVATDMAVTFRDVEDPSKMVNFIISCGEIPGVPMQVMYFTTNDDYYRVDGFGYYDQEYKNIWDAHKTNELGIRDYEPNVHYGVFVADGTDFTETTALKFGVGTDGLYYQGNKVSDVANSSMFPSGYVTAEVNLYNFFNTEENDCTKGYINFISLAGKSLANINEDTEGVSNWVNNSSTTSRSGQTYASTEIPLEKTGVTKWNTIDTGVSNTITVSGTVADFQEGFMFQIEAPVGTKTGTDMAVAFRDAEDPTKVVRYIIGTGGRVGVDMNELHFDTNDEFNRRDGYGYYDGTEHGCILDAHKVNELGVRDYEPNVHMGVLGADGTDFTNTTALLFAIKEDGCYFQTEKKWDGVNSSLFTSGKIVAEITVYNFFNFGENEIKGSCHLISLGGKSLATLTEYTPDLKAPVINYTDCKLDKQYEFASAAEIAEKLTVTVEDNRTAECELSFTLLDVEGAEVIGETLKVQEGYKLKVVATDGAGNTTEKLIDISVIIPVYTVTFYNGDGSVLAEVEVEEGLGATAPETVPTKESTVSVAYTFSGWNVDFSNITADLEVVPVFTESARTYTITWVNGELETETQVTYGETPAYVGDTPIKGGDAQYEYAFAGWTPEIVAVVGDATYTAQFTQTVRTYTITWVVDGVSTTTQVAYGEMPAYEGTPAKASDETYDYTFTGWDIELVTVTGEATYTAQFDATEKEVPPTSAPDDSTTSENESDEPTSDTNDSTTSENESDEPTSDNDSAVITSDNTSSTADETPSSGCSSSVSLVAPVAMLGLVALVKIARKREDD